MNLAQLSPAAAQAPLRFMPGGQPSKCRRAAEQCQDGWVNATGDPTRDPGEGTARRAWESDESEGGGGHKDHSHPNGHLAHA